MSNKEHLAHVTTEKLLAAEALTLEMVSLVRKQADTLEQLAKCLHREAERRRKEGACSHHDKSPSPSPAGA